MFQEVVLKASWDQITEGANTAQTPTHSENKGEPYKFEDEMQGGDELGKQLQTNFVRVKDVFKNLGIQNRGFG